MDSTSCDFLAIPPSQSASASAPTLPENHRFYLWDLQHKVPALQDYWAALVPIVDLRQELNPEIFLIHDDYAEIIIGRDQSYCGGYFARHHRNDMAMSRKHCFIKRAIGSGETVVGAISGNGTKIQSTRLLANQTGIIRDDDNIAFGISNTSNVKGQLRMYSFRLLKSPAPQMAVIREHYLLEKQLGKGGYGVVFKGYDKKTNEAVAIKFVPAARISSEDWEDRSMLRLKHDNIIEYKARYVDENGVYYVLQFADGGDLWSRVGFYLEQACLMPEAEAKHLVRQICLGLAHVHSQGIAHRDIKPENILLTRDGKVKITDFGLSKDAVQAPGLRTYEVGTEGYRAPEINERLAGEAYTVKVDCYSVGATLLFMLTGGAEFHVRGKLRDDVWEQLETWNTTPEVRDFARRLMCPDPEIRMSMDEALRHPWLADPSCSANADETVESMPSTTAAGPVLDNQMLGLRLTSEAGKRPATGSGSVFSSDISLFNKRKRPSNIFGASSTDTFDRDRKRAKGSSNL
ncbi:hypothetical protein BOTBODRAFT_533008 [Botryobasidium botryosum FD-172 SS1]|uniref:non-specific serine/threonine protein kinase n=1 Tax=Botryobasidium botryosum (strain FD-172 SS1) TaxID=930990 RepID=A0A067MC39_BOTB1|nr:hypothetical protein BOTBODRAFT_533008 [Botryobasidium botryosum FD-172 SS1]